MTAENAAMILDGLRESAAVLTAFSFLAFEGARDRRHPPADAAAKRVE